MSFYKTFNLQRCIPLLMNAVRQHHPTCRPLQNRLASSFTTLKIDESGLATLTMKRPPVNSLNVVMLQEISQHVKEMENTPGCKGFVLTSDVPKIFSAGLDITQLHQAKSDDLRIFWHSLQEVWLSLFGTKLASVAAITGHAPAGGCLMTLCCDYRIMTGPGPKIGLNEVLLGFPAPPWLRDTMEYVIGWGKAERALCLGAMFTPEDALKQGIVDEVVETPEKAVEKGKDHLRKLAAIPEHARQATKLSMRQSLLKKFHNYREDDLNNYVEFLSGDEVQNTIGSYFESLKKKKAA